ncbi:MAG TPA: PspC domain-containing protein [Opitutaceae bacterium]|nr:PspC domain-containing protein [Opitutaceae bacterium]
MNKVITVNLNGNAYQLEEDGYNALRAYLEGAAQRLAHNPDRDEIIADIEQAIADKFRAILGKFKSVVETKEVLAVIAEMGPVRDDADDSDATSTSPTSADADKQQTRSANMNTANTADTPSDSNGPARRLYKIPEGAMVAGVCNGVAAYFGLDPILVRLGFLVLSLIVALFALLVHWFLLLPFIAYTVLAFVLPAANTPAERAAARGDPSTAQEYIRRAKQGYYEGVKNFTAATSNRHWRAKWRQEMRAHGYPWRHYSNPAWQGAGGVGPSLMIGALTLAEVVVFFVWLSGLMNLVTHHSAFGIALPPDVPLWVGIIVMVFALHVLLWPLRAFKYACYMGATGGRSCGYHGGFFDSLVSLAAIAAGIWFADHYIPQFHEFLLALPARIDSAAQAISAWWSQR